MPPRQAVPARAVPPSPLQRAAVAAGSLLLLASLVAGLPVALVLLAGNPLPDDMPTLDGIRSALVSPDDGTLFLGVLTVVGWLAWASFTGSVLLELVARLGHRKVPAVPGLRGQQRLAAVLVAAVAAIAVTPTMASASAAMVDSPPPATALAVPVDPAGADHRPVSHAPAEASTQGVLHQVQRGEALLDLQERYGLPWQRIAEANYGAEQPDGRSLQRGQTRIYPGWQLRIPTSTTTADAGHHQTQYEVAKGDWMWHIADRYLGDPERYRDIAALNPQYEQRNGDFPDHIEPGWTLALPVDAVDSGPTRHATGTAEPAGGTAEAPPQAEQPADQPADQPAERPAGQPAGPGAPAVPEAAGLGTAPEHSSAGFGAAPLAVPISDRDDGAADPADAAGGPAGETDDPAGVELERFAPAMLVGAGILTALVLGAAASHQRRRNQHHRFGFRFSSPAAHRLDRALRAAAQPLDTARLDAALRALAAGLAGRAGPLPDIAGALVDDGSLHLLLASPCPDPPAPWQDHHDRWTLPAGTEPPPVTGGQPLAPLPTLAAVGSQAGVHMLLDLERLGFLTIHGEPARALSLLRYLAAELACNTWSDTTEVLLAGFDPRAAELLMAVNPDRVRALPSVPDAVARLRHRIASARATLGHTGAADSFAGRVQGVTGDAWMPQVLLAATASAADMAALSALAHDLDGNTRCAVAVAATDPNPPPEDRWRVSVSATGSVHVRLPFLSASMTAAALPVEELEPLAETMRAARAASQVPVPPAPETEPWAAGTTAAGALRSVGRAAVPTSWFASGEQPPPPAPARRTDDDRGLDDDLAEWHEANSARSRIGVLGPVLVDAPGTVPQTRRRLHAELVVFLAQRAGRGADARLIDAALWPDTHITDTARQLAISRARQWLGTGPDGTPWLPDVGPDLAYRLAEGFLLDWHLFRRLRTRGEIRGENGAGDLRAALDLVRGVPLAGADRPTGPGLRNPYPWLTQSDLHPGHLVATVVDTAHQLAELYLAAGDPEGARWAVRQAWLADPDRSYDQPWRDLLRAEHADGQTGRLRSILAELMEIRDAEAPEDLAPETHRLISCWPPNVLVPTG